VRDETRGGIPLRSLITLGILSMCWCFFSLDIVIDALTVMIILVQFIGQSVGLLVFRYGIHLSFRPRPSHHHHHFTDSFSFSPPAFAFYL
jgi:amino acid transporter